MRLIKCTDKNAPTKVQTKSCR